jgi:hypothetical protein
MYNVAHDPIVTVYFLNPSCQSVCLHVYPCSVARQRLGKLVTAAVVAQATIELLETFHMTSVSNQRKLGD